MIHTHIQSIRYDAFVALPKSNKREYLCIALVTAIFLVLAVTGMLIVMPADAETSDASNALVFPAFGFIALLFWVVAARHDRGSTVRERAFLQFVEDNKPHFNAELYPGLQPFTTSSLVINAGTFDSGPRRGFLLQGSIDGCTFMLYNTMLFSRRRSFRYSNPVRTVIEIPLPKEGGMGRYIGENKFNTVAYRGIKRLHPQRTERERHKTTFGQYSVYSEQEISEHVAALIMAVATSIKDVVRWSAFEINDGRLYLFGSRGLWFNEKELRETFEQIHILGISLAKIYSARA